MIYVYCPKGAETGGPEALHQLVDSLNRRGRDAALIPMPSTRWNREVETYKKYCAPWLNGRPADLSSNSVVVPEIAPELLDTIGRANKYVWLLAKAEPTRDDCKYLAQSEYARVPGAMMLSDYTVGEGHTGPHKTNIIAYNGNKGATKVEAVARFLPQYEFVAIRGMSRSEGASLLSRAAIYLDLGHHPGKDRLPREAAKAGCVVVTGRDGSAGNDIDVPIEEKIVEGADPEVTAVVVEFFMKHLEQFYDNQKTYREKIAMERAVFYAEVREIFG